MPTRGQPKDLTLRSRRDFCEVKRQAPLREASTLYLETAYYGRHESEYLSQQFKGVPYAGIDDKMLRALKVVYVGMSRPRYLLCVAIQKDRFDQMNCDELREIWDVQSA